MNTVGNNTRSIVRVANLSNNAIRIRQGQPIAHVTIINDNSKSSIATQKHSPDLDNQLAQIKINPSLPAKDKESVLDVIRRHRNVFSWTSNDLVRTDLVEHSIQLTTDKTKHNHTNRMSLKTK